MYTIKLLDRPPGSVWSKVLALNSHGHAVGFTQVDTEFQPMLWNPNPKHFSFKAQATGINDSGDVVGFFEDVSHSFLIRKNGNGKPEPLIKFDSFARAINNDGFITGTFGNIIGGHPDLHAFIYNPDKQTEPIDLGVLPGDHFSQGYAINNKKQVTGLSLAHDTRAFFYDGATMMDLGPATAANDLNDAGQVVGARDVNGLRTAFLCETSSGTPQFEDIHTMEVNGINNNGDIVGSSQGVAFVRLSGGGAQNLNSLIANNTGWVLDSATRINDNGQIVGLGRHNGSEQSYLLTPGPDNVHFDRAEIISLVLSALAWGTAGVWFGPGTLVIPINPPPRFQGLVPRLSPEKQEMLIGIVLSEFASLALEGRSRDELEKYALNMIRRALDQLTGTYVPPPI